MKYILIGLIYILSFSSTLLLAQRYTISGYITDNNTGEYLIGAVVIVKNSNNIGYATNNYGFYSLSLVKGNYDIEFSFIGHKKQSVTVSLTSNKNLNVILKETSNELQEIVITSNNNNTDVRQAQMGLQKLNVKVANTLPVIFGEKDILKILQLFPGIKSGGDGQSGFTVRGGTTDQNLILLDNAPIYNASHLLGFFSTFNSDAIKDVSIYKGTAPAQYGGRISSVVDVKMNEGNNQNIEVKGGIGLISSKLNIEGPIQKGKSSFLISGRSTYIDIFLKMDDQFKNNSLSFYDLNAKLNFITSDKDRLFISGYLGRDALGLNKRMGIDWGNKTATARWSHLFNSKLFSNTSLIYSDYDYKINIKNPDNEFTILSSIKDWNLKQMFQYFPDSINEWKFGYNLIHHTIAPGIISFPNITISNEDPKSGLESAIFATNNWQATNKLKINYGIRFSSFLVLGGSDYYKLDAYQNVTDTIRQANPIKNYLNIEPRLSINYNFNENSSFKMAYTRNVQNLHLITNSVSGSPTDKWIMNTNNVKPEISDQISLGYFHNFNDNNYELSVESYYKSMQNQIDYKDNADVQIPVIETQLLYGIGRAYGLEILLKKNKGKFTGWLGYSLSRSEKQIDGINKNSWYPARQDRTHDISIVGMYEISKRWIVSAIWVYRTGNAISFPSGKYLLEGQTVWLYTERNGYRMPAYHRLDLGATYKFKEHKLLNSELSFGLFNVYGRENPYIITFERSGGDPNQTVAIQTSLFRWVPSISWDFTIR